MKWIKLSDELPPFNKEIVLLSDRGFTRLSFRRTKEVSDKLQVLLRNACKLKVARQRRYAKKTRFGSWLSSV